MSSASSAASLIDLRKGHPRTRNMPHALLARACRQAAARLDSASESQFPLQYSSSACGNSGYLAKLGAFLRGAYASPVFDDGLLTTNGVSHGLELCCAALTQPGDTVWLETPSYFLAHQIFLDHGLHVRGVPIDADGLDVDALAELLGRSDTTPPRLLYVVPSHGNPSGAVLPVARREALLELARTYGFIVITDDVYHLLDWTPPATDGGSAAPPPSRLLEMDAAFKRRVASGSCGDGGGGGGDGEAEDDSYTNFDRRGESDSAAELGHVISLGSFTKILAPGLRLGWLESSPGLIAKITARGYLVSGGSVAPFASEVVSELLVADGQAAQLLTTLIADYSHCASVMCDALRRAGCFELLAPPRGGFFVWVGLPADLTAAQLLPIAERHGVVFLPGHVCAPHDPASAICARYVRLCFAYEEAGRIEEGVGRLAAAVAELQRRGGHGGEDVDDAKRPSKSRKA